MSAHETKDTFTRSSRVRRNEGKVSRAPAVIAEKAQGTLSLSLSLSGEDA